MVELTGGLDRRSVLEVLDETPQTPRRLARRLDADADEVEAVLEELGREQLVVDWGDVWATTWRAKLDLSPRFFRVWVPGSLALGAGLTALGLALNGPPGTWGPAAAALLAVGAGLLAVQPVLGSG